MTTSTDKPALASKKFRLCLIGVVAIVGLTVLALVMRPDPAAYGALGLAYAAIGAIISVGAGVQGGVDMMQARKDQ